MAIDEADQSDAGDFSEGEGSDSVSEEEGSHESEPSANSAVRVGEYTWEEFMDEHGYGDEVSVLYPDDPEPTDADDQLGLDTDTGVETTVPSGDDWNQVAFDPESYLGHHPDDLADHVLPIAGDNADTLWDSFLEYVDPETTPVVKDTWTWEHYKWEYYYEDDGSRPRDSNGNIVRHDKEEALGFDPDTLEQRLAAGNDAALELDDIVDERTVNIQEEIDEDEFFSTAAGNTTVSNRYDLEKAVPMEKKTHFREVERYWVNKPYAFVVIFHSEKENEKKYYMVEPYQNEIETELQEFLSGKLRTAIKYAEEGIKEKATEDGRRTVIEDEARRLLERYDLFEATSDDTSKGFLETLQELLDDDEDEIDEDDGPRQLEGIEVRPEPAILADDPDTLNEYQVEKLLYLLKRDFIGYERIDGIKHDINVEDISCDGYNSPVFVYHSEYEQIISNIYHGEDELDDFVVKLAQRSGKGISKRLPQVDATLPDGSRAQLTLGKEVSDHGTNYTIRQFKDVPFTPIDLINWNTFSLDEMAFLWLAIENHKSLIFAGGTASGKTTSLNAVSLFIPSSAKIVSIEDTREVELPQRNWIASVTRPSFADDEQGDVDEFDLLEAALRQRPDYIVMGEIRGEEGRTLFQVMSTGHTTYTTFHADSVDEVLKRFTTDPINVSKTMFTALDLVSIQTQTRVQGRKVRRNKSLTEINHYEAEHDEINVQDVYQWQAETDEFLKMGDSNTLEEIQFDRGWSKEKLEEELFKREVILAYLIKNGLNTYAQVAATVQAFINDPDTILTLIANGQLEDSLEDLREMESVLIDVDQEKEELVPRPDATNETYNLSMDILERAEESLFEEYRGQVPSGLASALGDVEEASPIDVDRADIDEFDFAGAVDDDVDEGEWELGDDSTAFAIGDDDVGDEPAWLSEDTGFDIESDDAAATADSTAEEGTRADTTGTDATAGVDESPSALEPAPTADEADAATDSSNETLASPETDAEPTDSARDADTESPT
ncbi:type II/IV secretion system ATPase subunit, partial [Haloarchaeobius amylolyticus]